VLTIFCEVSDPALHPAGAARSTSVARRCEVVASRNAAALADENLRNRPRWPGLQSSISHW
jgi:hypothetical protein